MHVNNFIGLGIGIYHLKKKTDCEKIFHCLYYSLHDTSRKKRLNVLLLTYKVISYGYIMYLEC